MNSEEIQSIDCKISEKKVLLVGAVSETAWVADAIADAGFCVFVSTATDSPLSLRGSPRIQRVCGRMDENDFGQFLRYHCVSAVVNISHPYSSTLRIVLRKATEKENVLYFSYLRPQSLEKGSACHHVFSHEQAAQLAVSFRKPVLLTIGTKDIAVYCTYAQSHDVLLIARVLPRIDSINACFDAGLDECSIVAARGPFTVEENVSLIHRHGIGVVVTKDGGNEGGFPQKQQAAKKCLCELIVVARPQTPEPLTEFSDPVALVKALCQALQ